MKRRRVAPWIAAAVGLVLLFVVIVAATSDPANERIADSPLLGKAAPAAQAIRTEIRRRIDAGQSRREIEAYLEGRYGSDILLTPPSSGIGGLVWVLPVVAIVGAAAGLGVALRRWSRRSLEHPTDEDRALVERAAQ
jgi:cytochrome c-type biogenesis protein CcmH/NrfF